MAYVYRYLDRSDNVKYVGIVHGDTLEDLRRRLLQHKNEPEFRPSWRIEYIPGLTRTDAEILEAHFIALNCDSCINKAKRAWGRLTLEITNAPDWREYNDADVLAQTRPFNTRRISPHGKVLSFTCSCCRGEVLGYPDNYIQIDSRGVINRYTTLFLCPSCEERLANEFYDFFAPILEGHLAFRPLAGRTYEDEHLYEIQTENPGHYALSWKEKL